MDPPARATGTGQLPASACRRSCPTSGGCAVARRRRRRAPGMWPGRSRASRPHRCGACDRASSRMRSSSWSSSGRAQHPHQSGGDDPAGVVVRDDGRAVPDADLPIPRANTPARAAGCGRVAGRPAPRATNRGRRTRRRAGGPLRRRLDRSARPGTSARRRGPPRHGARPATRRRRTAGSSAQDRNGRIGRDLRLWRSNIGIPDTRAAAIAKTLRAWRPWPRTYWRRRRRAGRPWTRVRRTW